MDRFDVAIVGAGILGLATAEQLGRRHPDRSVVVIERRHDVGLAQSGRNSGVLHSGIYYKPGSMKAETCRRGRALLIDFCEQHAVPVNTCGKLILATRPRDQAALETLARRAIANGVPASPIPPQRVTEIEPHANPTGALHVPDTAVVDFTRVCHALAKSIRARGARIVTDAGALHAQEHPNHLTIRTGRGDVGAKHLIACAGMGSERFARACGLKPGLRIVPFKGRYCSLRSEAAELCKALIYPVPDPRFPFLGAHFTRRIDGTVEVGPTAAVALSRAEGRALLADALSTLAFPGLWGLALRYAPTGIAELHRTFSRRAFAQALCRLVPDVTRRDLEPAPAGIRAQALRPDGSLVDDFAIVESQRMIHVCNAPSPAATASLAIADRLIDRLERRLGT